MIYTKNPVNYTAIQCIGFNDTDMHFNIKESAWPEWLWGIANRSINRGYYVLTLHKETYLEIHESDWLIYNPETENVETMRNEDFVKHYTKII